MESKGYPHIPQERNEAPYPQQMPYPQPPPAYEPNYGQQQQQHHQHQPIMQPHVIQTVYANPVVGPDPSSVICPSCRHQVITRLDYEVTTKTHLMAGLLCAFICWPCAWIPYVMDSCKNANHYCPNCGAFIGTYKS